MLVEMTSTLEACLTLPALTSGFSGVTFSPGPSFSETLKPNLSCLGSRSLLLPSVFKNPEHKTCRNTYSPSTKTEQTSTGNTTLCSRNITNSLHYTNGFSDFFKYSENILSSARVKQEQLIDLFSLFPPRRNFITENKQFTILTLIWFRSCSASCRNCSSSLIFSASVSHAPLVKKTCQEEERKRY